MAFLPCSFTSIHPSPWLLRQPHHLLNDSDLIETRGTAQGGVYRRAGDAPRASPAAIIGPQAARSEPAAHNKQAGGAGEQRCWRQRARAACRPGDGDAGAVNTDATLHVKRMERGHHTSPGGTRRPSRALTNTCTEGSVKRQLQRPRSRTELLIAKPCIMCD